MSRILRPPLLSAPRGKSALSVMRRSTVLKVLATVSDSFDSLANFVTLSGTPTITSGRLSGNGIVRYRDQMGSDNYQVTATVGTVELGRTWLVTCGSANFETFYALEIAAGVGNPIFQFVKGTHAAGPGTAIFGVLTSIFTFLRNLFLGIFESVDDVDRYASGSASLTGGDEVTVWWDEDTSTLYAYKNGSEVISLAVPPWEIPHGGGFRYFGVMQAVDPNTNGVQFTSIGAQDVPWVTGS